MVKSSYKCDTVILNIFHNNASCDIGLVPTSVAEPEPELETEPPGTAIFWTSQEPVPS